MTASGASREGGKVRWGEDWTWEQIGLCGKGVGLDSGHRVLPAPAKIFRSENIPFRFSLSKELSIVSHRTTCGLTGNMFWTSSPLRDSGVQRLVGRVGTIDSLQTY